MTWGGTRPPPNSCLIDEVSTEEDEIGVEGACFSDDALEAGDVAGMRASVKIRKEDHSERTGPSRPPIDS